MEGWLAVTVSGLVTVSLLKPGGALLTASESLCRLRGRVALADIAFTGGGNIVVAATDGSSSSPVQFYKVRTRSRAVPWSLLVEYDSSSDLIVQREGQEFLMKKISIKYEQESCQRMNFNYH